MIRKDVRLLRDSRDRNKTDIIFGSKDKDVKSMIHREEVEKTLKGHAEEYRDGATKHEGRLIIL